MNWDNLTDSVARAVDGVGPTLRSREFELFVSYVKGAKTPIVFTGVGKSGLVARRVAATWTSLGLQGVFVHPVEWFHGDYNLVQPGGVLVALSQSGTTDEVRDVIEHHVHSRKGAAFLVTRRMGEAADNFMTLETHVHYEGNSVGFPMASLAAQAMILDAAAVQLCHELAVTAEYFKRNHPGGTIGHG